MHPTDPLREAADAVWARAEPLTATRSLVDSIAERTRIDAVTLTANSLDSLQRRIEAQIGVTGTIRRLLPDYGPPKSLMQ